MATGKRKRPRGCGPGPFCLRGLWLLQQLDRCLGLLRGHRHVAALAGRLGILHEASSLADVGARSLSASGGTGAGPRRLHVLVTAGRLDVLIATRRLDILVPARRLHILVAARRLDILVTARRLHVLVPTRRLHVLVATRRLDILVPARRL